MIIAQKLKKENICEYLLYMWQIEDLIRAYNLDLDLIKQQIVDKYPLSDNEKKMEYDWYESLTDMMRRENVKQIGHLQINKNVMNELDELHSNLLKSGIDPFYNAKFYHVLPSINQLRMQQTDISISDIEICFNFQYGILLLRMKKKMITTETTKAQAEMAKYLVNLAENYSKYQRGELNFEFE